MDKIRLAKSSFSLPPMTRSLSARLLVLTIIFVLIGEVLIYVPSVARYRHVFLQERIEAARIAALAVEAAPDGMVTEELRKMLLVHSGVLQVSLKREERRMLILVSEMPYAIGATFAMAEETPWWLIRQAFDAMSGGGERVIRVIGAAPEDRDGTSVDILLDEGPMVAEMLDYSRRILQLSLVLAAITAGFVYLSLHLLLVRPLRQMSDNLVSFRRAPEDATTVMARSRRRDEIGVAQRELRVMQQRVRAALRQKARLASVGAAVSKINHDLRNMLATALVVSDRLAITEDPETRKVSAPLLAALDRAINLCTQTLSFARAEEPDAERGEFPLAPLVDEVALVLPKAQIEAIQWRNDVPDDLRLLADRDQVYRILMNLTKNAVEAVAVQGPGGTVRVTGWHEGENTTLEIAETGPGIPERAREHLFEAFAGSVGGTGLGLAIAFELTRNHGGRLELLKSDPTGTVFRAIFPNSVESLREQQSQD
ncbi:MAG: HAMP domain-containing sensor histidine kinase [Alphaproteobacteria bacterium]